MSLPNKVDTIVRLVTKLLVVLAGILLGVFVGLDATQESNLLVIGTFGFFATFTGFAFDWSGFWKEGEAQHRQLRSAGEAFLLGSILVLLSLLFSYLAKDGGVDVPAVTVALRVLHVGTLAVALAYGVVGCLKMLSVGRQG